MTLCFEKLSLRHVPLALLARAFSWRVAAFDQDFTLRTRRTVAWLELNGIVSRLLTFPFGTSHSDAIDWADQIIGRHDIHRAIRSSVTLYRSGDILLVFKRCLAERLSRSLEVVDYFQRKTDRHLDGTIWLVAPRLSADLSLLRRHGWSGKALPDDVHIVWSSGFGALLSRAFANGLFLTSAILKIGSQIFRRANVNPLVVNTAVAISSPFQLKFQGPRRFDFLTDGSKKDRDDFSFLIELPLGSQVKTRLFDSDRKIVDITGPLQLGFFFKSNVAGPWVRQLARTVLPLFFFGWRHFFIAEGVRTTVGGYVFWNSVLSHVRFDHYVCTNKEHRMQIAGSVLMRAVGIKTTAFSQFIGGPYQLTSPYDRRNAYWSFLSFDVYALNNAAMVECFRMHRQSVGQYAVIGNIFSDLICQARNGLQKASSPQVISIFDTTFVDAPAVVSTFDDCIAFLIDMIKLANSRPDVKFVFKPSKKDSYFTDPHTAWSSAERGQKIVDLRRRFAALQNVHVLDDAADPVSVIADSNLTITHCFSSPTADALAAGVSAIWYEATGKLRDFPFAHLKGAVVHGYDELVARLGHLLGGRGLAWESHEFGRMIDPYRDGNSLERLRSLLKRVSK